MTMTQSHMRAVLLIIAASCIRFSAGAWSVWLDGDNPGGSGDFEVYKIYDPPPCGDAVKATAAECRPVGGGTSEGQTFECTINGLRCRNADNLPDGCVDFEVRFMCPTVETTSPTQISTMTPTSRPTSVPTSGWKTIVSSNGHPIFVNITAGAKVDNLGGGPQISRKDGTSEDWTNAVTTTNLLVDGTKIVGFYFRAPSPSINAIAGLTTNAVTTRVQNLQFSVQLNSKGEVYRNENGLTEGRIGNYGEGTHIGILVSHDSADNGRQVHYLIEDNVGVMRVADTSTDSLGLPMQLVVALNGQGDSVDSVRWLSNSAWCHFLVECEKTRTCQINPTCSLGVCNYEGEPDGTSCDDRNSSTTLDACYDSKCVGEHPCANTVCQDFGDCVSPSRCVATPGSTDATCYPGLWYEDGTVCDDGNHNTHHDACDRGICQGVPKTTAPTFSPTTVPTTSKPTIAPTTSPLSQAPSGSPSVAPSTSTPTVAPTTPVPTPSPSQMPTNAPSRSPITTAPTPPPSLLPTFSTPTMAPTFMPTTAVPTTSTPTGSPTPDLSCVDITCPPVECFSPGRCSVGKCYPGQPMAEGTSCDDDNIQTADDVCFNGVCKGTDLCAGIQCPASDECHQTGICSQGICSPVFQRDGLACDDDNSGTIDDQCVSGVCFGTDTCADVTCSRLSQCHVVGDCIRGVCSNPLVAQGLGCDDQNSSSVDDVCDGEGGCKGVDPCLGVVCEGTNCFDAGVCIGGDCTLGPQKAAGSVCDDGMTRTTSDQCDRFGNCFGVDLCDMFNITCETDQCNSRSNCWLGRCVKGTPFPDGIPCDDQKANTDDQCIGGSCVGTLNQCFGVTCVQPASQCLVSLCDDSNGQCVDLAKPRGTYCDDANDTTSSDECDGLGTCKGEDLCDFVTCPTLRECEMHEPSYVNGCFRGVCLTVQIEDGTSCDDGNEVTDDDQCIFGTCFGVDKCVGVECEQPDTVCKTGSTCSHGTCSTPQAVPDRSFCEDDDPRTEDECVNGVCVSTDLCDSVECEAAPFSCEIRSCFRGNCSLEYYIDGTLCDDGITNTVEDACHDQVCRGGRDTCKDIACEAINDCHIGGVCELGRCSDQTWKPTGTTCDDGDNRTDTDACARGVCRGRDLCDDVTCPESDQCHSVAPCFRGSCTRTVNVGAVCDDQVFTTETDRCQADGSCVGVDRCVTDAVVCPRAPQCFTGGECLRGSCQKLEHSETGTPCDDGNPLTDVDRCVNGRCDGINLCLGVECLEPTTCFTPGPCMLGVCTEGTNAEDGTVCDDDDRYTDLDVCESGVCVGSYTCTDFCRNTSNTCNVPICRSGECSETPRDNGYLCDDSDAETLNDRCQDGQCVGTDLCKDVVCDPRSQCHNQGSCSLGRCTDVPKPDNTPCDDGDSSTTSDVCDAGVCNGVDPCADVECDEETQCLEASQCVLGTCSFARFKADNTSCNDDNTDTYADICRAGQCVGSRVCLDGCVAFTEAQALSENVAYGLTRPEGSGTGWDASAVSIGTLLPGEGVLGGVQFTTAQADQNVVIGLGYGTDDPGYQSTEFAMFFSMQGRVLLYESGEFIRDLGAYRREDVVSITITAEGYPEYRIGIVGDKFQARAAYTSKQKATPDKELKVEVAIFDSGASVNQFQFLTRQEVFCAPVTCTAPSSCYELPECVLGECAEADIKADPTACNDGDDVTTQDMCQSDGSCKGVDLCIGIDCADDLWCESAPTCSHGVCSECVDACVDVTCDGATDCLSEELCVRGDCVGATPMANGTSCDDNIETTDNDQCDGAGACVGVDLCVGVECPEANMCEVSHLCSHGSCSIEYEPNGTSCDDSNDATTDDACDGTGECVGREYCSELEIECAEPDQCNTQPDCYQGKCPTPLPKQTGTVCDDDNARTDNDACFEGVCVGVDFCVTRNVLCDDNDCSSEGTCRNGECFYDEIAPENKPCDDKDDGTVSDKCILGVCVGLDLCEGITCADDGGQCRQSSFCSLGKCLQGEPHNDGRTCDDGNTNTVNDACTSGVCQGVDLCADITCPPIGLDPCLKGDKCVLGQCEITRIPVDGACDDGDVATDADVCDAFGTCFGKDLCVENAVECDRPDQCHFGVSCMNGVCPSMPSKPNGTACDDGEVDTVTDVCTNGVCSGTNPCDGVVCPDSDQCHHERECQIIGIEGICNNVPRTDGTECGDGNSDTIDDQCRVGRCVGTPLLCDSADSPNLSFNNDCDGFDSSAVRWTAADEDDDCACTMRGGASFSTKTPLSMAQCAHLICVDGGFSFTTCKYRGVEAAVGSWIDTSTIQVQRAFEDVLCGLRNLSSDTTTQASATTDTDGVARSELSACTVDTRVVDWSKLANGIDIEVMTNDSVTWNWQGPHPLNVRSSVGNQFFSGSPTLTGSFTQKFDTVGTYAFRSDIFTWLAGRVVVKARPQNERTTYGVEVVAHTAPVAVTLVLTPDLSQELSTSVSSGGVVQWQWTVGDNLRVESVMCATIEGRPKGALFSSRNTDSDSEGKFSLEFSVLGDFEYQVWSGDEFVTTGYVHVTDATSTSTTKTATTATATTNTQSTVTLTSVTSATTTTQSLTINMLRYNATTQSETLKLDGSNALRVDKYPDLLQTFSFAFVGTLARGTSGYLFSQSDSTGVRYVSLYVSADSANTILFYRSRGTSIQRGTRFATNLATGGTFRLVMNVDKDSATLHVVYESGVVFKEEKTLDGSISTCHNSDLRCHLVIGARVHGDGTFIHTAIGSVYTALLRYSSIGSLPNAVTIDTTDAPNQPPMNLLPSQNTIPQGVTSLGDGSLSFDGKEGFLKLTAQQTPAAVGYSWGMLAWVKQTPGTSGYIFAKTDSSGSRRYLGLYSSAKRGLVLYYSSRTRTTAIEFPSLKISDGFLHSVLVYVLGRTVTIVVDTTVARQVLPSLPFDDCTVGTDSNCHFSIGQRMSNSNSGGAYRYQGTIHSILLNPNGRVYPNEADARFLDLLSTLGSPSSFSGDGGKRLREFRKVKGSFKLEFDIKAWEGSNGYLVSKSNADGTIRHFALYGTPKSLIFHYKSGIRGFETVSFNVAVFDGIRHKFTVAVVGDTVELTFDNKVQPRVELVGFPQDCSADENDCLLHIGEQPNNEATTSDGFSGIMHLARLEY